jgi:DNA invertase Pin-like site-specific DNA recombinase
MADDGKYIAYYRVSTQQQGVSGLGLEAQQASVTNYLNGGKWQVLASFTEVESGRKSNRPQLAAALKMCKLTGAKLLIAKLDRLARNVAFIANLMESGVKFVAVDMPQANNMTIHILAAVAEGEAEMISSRTKAALQAAKARGVKLGGARGATITDATREASLKVRQETAAKRNEGILTTLLGLKAQGFETLNQLADELNRRGYTTARGKQWSHVQVMRIMK